MFHSSDGGKTWQRVKGAAGIAAGVDIRSIAISRDEDGPIILGSIPPIISYDRGKTWQVREPAEAAHGSRDIHAGPAGSHVFYARGGGGICRSDDDGKSWKDVGRLPSEEPDITYIYVDRFDADTVSCMARWPRKSGRGSAFYVSRDGGQSLREIALPEGTHFAASLSTDPEDPGVLYLCARPTGFGRSRQGTYFYSYDEGATWELFWDPESPDSPSALTVRKLRQLFPDTIVARPPMRNRIVLLPDEVACSEDKPGRVVAACFGRVFRSDDFGATWELAMTGLVATSVWRIVFDPADPKAAYCADARKVWRTGDRGTTWDSAAVIEYSIVQQIRFAPDGKHVLVVSHGIWRGTSDGKTWEHVWATSGRRSALALFFHEAERQDGETEPVGVLVGNYLRVESKDGGATWPEAGKTKFSMGTARFDRHVVQTVCDGEDTWLMCRSRDDALWSSTDRGRTWQPHEPTKEHKVRAWSIAGDGTIWLVDDEGGLWTFSPVGEARKAPRALGVLDLSAIACDPADPKVVYLGTRDGKLARTTDGGESYEVIEGGPERYRICSLAVSPHDGSLWVGASANGVWILDSAKAHPGKPISD